MKNKIKKLIVNVIKLFSYLIPKSKKIWVFGAWGGKLYADNAKYMFEYAHSIKGGQKLIWISSDKNVVKQVRTENKKAYYFKSFLGIWYVIRAYVAFETEGELDISYFLDTKRTKVIQLWHGMGAKAMKWKGNDGAISIREKNNMQRLSSYYWISTSELYTNIISELLGVPKERFVITGYPRNDNILTAPYNENMESLKKKYSDCKFIIYMPTHRNFGKDGNKLINLEELKRVDKILKEKNMVMVYKPHIHELKNFLSYESVFTNIVMAKEQ